MLGRCRASVLNHQHHPPHPFHDCAFRVHTVHSRGSPSRSARLLRPHPHAGCSPPLSILPLALCSRNTSRLGRPDSRAHFAPVILSWIHFSNGSLLPSIQVAAHMSPARPPLSMRTEKPFTAVTVVTALFLPRPHAPPQRALPATAPYYRL